VLGAGGGGVGFFFAGFRGAGFAATLAPALEEPVAFLRGGEACSLSFSLLRLVTALVARFFPMLGVDDADGRDDVIGSSVESGTAGTSLPRAERSPFVRESGVPGKG
jgi:hypothetical protein